MSTPLRVALIGCGQIADAHLQEINKIPAATAVAVCDRHADLAYQAGARFGVRDEFTDVAVMLQRIRPDVVHITTPPHTHMPLAIQCLEAGAHVYIEKPFTLDLAEADRVLETARAVDRLVCVGHDQIFQPVWRDCVAMLRAGELGDVVHLDCVRGYDLGGPYGALISADPTHWIHRMPGGIFQNVISHALCFVAPFVNDASPSVCARWFGSAGSTGLPTELRAFVTGATSTASLTVSSTSRPVQRLIRVCGTRGTVEVDFDGGVVRRAVTSRLPGAFGRVEWPARQLTEAWRNFGLTVRRFARSDIQYFAGMNGLFAAFYHSIAEGLPPPVAYDEIRRVTSLMDRIFRECRESAAPRATSDLTQGAA